MLRNKLSCLMTTKPVLLPSDNARSYSAAGITGSEDSDMTETQKQQILVALSCPCCGGTGMSLSIPLDNSKPVF